LAYNSLRDGDAVVTAHGLVFYVFGYEHHPDRYNGFLKYVPRRLADLFDVEFIDLGWRRHGETLVRPKELYSPKVHPRIVEAFRTHLPDYLLWSGELDRWMVTIPRDKIIEVHEPSRTLQRLIEEGPRDSLEGKAINLLRKISDASSVSLEFFGVHGSISLRTSRLGSDIDLAVYGSANYRNAKEALLTLEGTGLLRLKRGDRIDGKRLNRGIFQGKDFVLNATRLRSEVGSEPKRYKPIEPVVVECTCVSAEEAMFRPAIYKVDNCSAVGVEPDYVVSEVVSNIGMHRDMIAMGEVIRARGVLEEVSTANARWLRVVVGSSLPGECLNWLEP
jgi:predicted nucleotidyltransferase